MDEENSQCRDEDPDPERPERTRPKDSTQASGNLRPLVHRLWLLPLFDKHRRRPLLNPLNFFLLRLSNRHLCNLAHPRHQPPPPPIHAHRRNPPFPNQKQRQHTDARLQPTQHAQRFPAPCEPRDEFPCKDDVDGSPEAGETADEAGGEAAVGKEPLCREGEDEGDDEGLTGAIKKALESWR